MQNQNHTNLDDKFTMNFGGFDTDNLFNTTHMGNMGVGMKRSAHDAGLDRESMGLSSDDDSDFMKKEGSLNSSSGARENMMHHQQTSLDQTQQKQNILPNGKKTKGRVKIKMEFIDNKLRRYTTFSKRKTGIMKKVRILSNDNDDSGFCSILGCLSAVSEHSCQCGPILSIVRSHVRLFTC